MTTYLISFFKKCICMLNCEDFYLYRYIEDVFVINKKTKKYLDKTYPVKLKTKD